MKLFHNLVTYFNEIWVICGEITYTSNIFEIDPLRLRVPWDPIYENFLILFSKYCYISVRSRARDIFIFQLISFIDFITLGLYY